MPDPGETLDAWIARMTPEERAALRARLGAPEPWEVEGGVASSPEPVEARYVAAWKRRMRRQEKEPLDAAREA